MNKQIIRLLEEKNIKITSVRMLVLDVFLQNNFALSLANIEDELPWSDRISIYRTLKTFEKKTLIHQVNDGSKSTKYALCSEHCNLIEHKIHPHFHCEKCNKTICLEEQKININNIPPNITINNYSLVLNGLCSDCISSQS